MNVGDTITFTVFDDDGNIIGTEESKIVLVSTVTEDGTIVATTLDA